MKPLRQKAPPPAAEKSGADVVSYYRRHARLCESAAGSAPTEEARSALRKMVPVWRDFAVEHERKLRESGKEQIIIRSVKPCI